ncbi:acetolactate synthase large subunit [Carnimonas bestiolae]|uniref:acetolactate synthase large subunit n=1 Tax=Carnimonas bestiolae TaxID=3402172 RepID=UPI003EDC5267
MTKASDLLVAALENEGVERIFGIPGEENLDIVESLRHSSITLTVTRHEQAAAFMAATYGRLTGKPGVCLTTLGPGALNLSTGAAYAHLGAMPMIMLTGQKGILSERQGRFQIVDVVATMRPITKMSRQIVSGQTIPTLIRDAFRVATEERPGPVHLELPEDIAREEVDNIALIPPHNTEPPITSDTALDAATELLKNAKRPLVMLGAAASRPRLAGKLHEFFVRTQIPFITTQMGKGAVSNVSDLYMGTAALSERDYVHEAVEAADLIISVGHDTIEKPPFIMGEDGPQVVHIGYEPAHVESVYFPQTEVIGDIGNALSRLADRIGDTLPNAGALLSMRENILTHIQEHASEDRWTPQRVVADIREVMPRDGIVTLDNGMYKIWFARNYRTDVANSLLLDNALATMGAGLPSGIAAALEHPDRRVLTVSGDGGFMMNSQELETAVRLKLNLVNLIIDDNAYGMIRWKQAVDKFADFGMTFNNPDFVSYAQSFGAKGHFVERIEEFKQTLEQAFSEGGVHVVAIPIDYADNITVLIDELNGAARTTAAD